MSVPSVTHQLGADLSDGLLAFSVPTPDRAGAGPVRGVVNERGVATDMVVLGYPYPLGISERARDAFVRAGLTGWTTRQLAIEGWRKPHYAVLIVTGRCGPVDWSRSSAIRDIGRWKQYVGLFPANPDSENDFCVPDDRSVMLVTDRVVQCIHEARLTGCVCVPLTEATSIR